LILVDTSIWVDHLRTGLPTLSRLLGEGGVLAHPWVIGELACGNLRDRSRLIQLLKGLPQAPLAMDAEVMLLIERHQWMGRGIGWIDAHLLASTLLASARLWSGDGRLSLIATELGAAATGLD
jgi:predicted nucleic acid-binding protein